MLGDAIQFFGTEKEDRTTDHYKLATQTMSTMVQKLGYCQVCARQAILYLLKAKYLKNPAKQALALMYSVHVYLF